MGNTREKIIYKLQVLDLGKSKSIKYLKSLTILITHIMYIIPKMYTHYLTKYQKYWEKIVRIKIQINFEIQV